MHYHLWAQGSLTVLPRTALRCTCTLPCTALFCSYSSASRSTAHDSGSYYFEWGGYLRQGQYGWHDPSLYLFVMAFHALESEKWVEQGGVGRRLMASAKLFLGIW